MSRPSKAAKTALSIEAKFFEWMAKTRTGTMFKVTVSAAIMWSLDNISNWDIPPLVMVAGTALLTYVINEINPRDTRYGIGSNSSGNEDA